MIEYFYGWKDRMNEWMTMVGMKNNGIAGAGFGTFSG